MNCNTPDSSAREDLEVFSFYTTGLIVRRAYLLMVLFTISTQCQKVNAQGPSDGHSHHIPKELDVLLGEEFICTLLFVNDSFCGHCQFLKSGVLISDGIIKRTVGYETLQVAHLSADDKSQTVLVRLHPASRFYRLIAQKNGHGVYMRRVDSLSYTDYLRQSKRFVYSHGRQISRLTMTFRSHRIRRSILRQLNADPSVSFPKNTTVEDLLKWLRSP